MGKIAFVTGANKGIGLEVARQLGEQGWKVLVGARDAEKGKAAVAELKAQELNASFVQIDLTDALSIEHAANKIREEHSKLSLLINNAGMPGAFSSSFSTTREQDLRNAFEVNFFGTFRLNQQLLPLIRENQGTIVNVSTDMASLHFMQNTPFALNCFDYNASKTASSAMTLAMSIELRDSEAQVFAVTPGFTKTDMNGNAEGGQSKEDGAKVIVRYATDGLRHNGELLDVNGVYAW